MRLGVLGVGFCAFWALKKCFVSQKRVPGSIFRRQFQFMGIWVQQLIRSLVPEPENAELRQGFRIHFMRISSSPLQAAAAEAPSGKWWGHGWGGGSESRVKRQKQDMKRLSSLKEAYKEKKKKKWKQVCIKRECDEEERAKAKSNGFLATLNGRVRKRKADNWEMSVKQNGSKEINNKKAENDWEEDMRTDDSESWWIGKGDSENKDESKEMWERQNIERKVEAIHKSHGWP